MREWFYTEALRLTVFGRIPSGTGADDEDYVLLRSGSTALEMMLRNAIGVAPAFHHPSSRVDVDAAAAALRARGVTLEKDPFDAAGNLRLGVLPRSRRTAAANASTRIAVQ